MIYRILPFGGHRAKTKEQARKDEANKAPLDMPTMKSQALRIRHARHGILATALLLGLVLVLTTWFAWRDAEALADTLSEGQAELFLRAMHTRRPPHGRGGEQELLAMLGEYRDQGLRGIGQIDDSGSIRAIAGDITHAPFPGGRPPPGRILRRVGGHWQILAPPLPGSDPAHGGLRPPRPPGPEARGPWPPPPPGFKGNRPPRAFSGPDEPPSETGEAMLDPLTHPLIFEFDPVFASQLTLRAKQTFFLATGAATLLAVAAIILWRRASREEALAARLSQSERLASLGTMSAVLAHEIKNPLAALKGNAQLVVESLAEESRTRGQAERVVEAAVRLQGLVQNLLDFARGGPIDRAEADPAELLFLAAEDAAPGATLNLDEAPASWSLDAIRIRQVLENLLRNAVQASNHEGVTASVGLSGDGRQLVYTVRDKGPGFPEGALESIFEPFFTTKTRGVGLGLAMARRVVAMHGGDITATNRPEGGAELRVSIPRA